MAYLSLRLAVWGLGALGEFRVPAFGGVLLTAYATLLGMIKF